MALRTNVSGGSSRGYNCGDPNVRDTFSRADLVTLRCNGGSRAPACDDSTGPGRSFRKPLPIVAV